MTISLGESGRPSAGREYRLRPPEVADRRNRIIRDCDPGALTRSERKSKRSRVVGYNGCANIALWMNTTRQRVIGRTESRP
jgi:hypothetical protein